MKCSGGLSETCFAVLYLSLFLAIPKTDFHVILTNVLHEVIFQLKMFLTSVLKPRDKRDAQLNYTALSRLGSDKNHTIS